LKFSVHNKLPFLGAGRSFTSTDILLNFASKSNNILHFFRHFYTVFLQSTIVFQSRAMYLEVMNWLRHELMINHHELLQGNMN
ncbi:MAG: hypothetical protein J6C41_04220, partial [Oscillospiraceae bacterium]|nr:hypothetical protein [Oscillospiraceae bacterium]